MDSNRLQRVALYARYSSDAQSEASIEDQLRICRVRAEREGWQVAGVYTDAAISGATSLRPGYQELLVAVRGGGLDLVLAESLDRFSRDQEHIAAFYKQTTFAGVRIVSQNRLVSFSGMATAPPGMIKRGPIVYTVPSAVTRLIR